MKLAELRRSGATDTRYVGQLSDVSGAHQYEIVISGQRRLVERMLAKSDFDIRIDSRASREDADRLGREAWERHVRPHAAPNIAETVESLSKRSPRMAPRASSIVVSLRRREGAGTFWTAFFPAVFVPRGASVFFVLPPVCNAFGSVLPLSGDPDLFLSLGGPFAPVIAASMRGGTLIDTVSFGSVLCWPWTQAVPWFRVFGFLTSVTGFHMSGFSTFP